MPVATRSEGIVNEGGGALLTMGGNRPIYSRRPRSPNVLVSVARLHPGARHVSFASCGLCPRRGDGSGWRNSIRRFLSKHSQPPVMPIRVSRWPSPRTV